MKHRTDAQSGNEAFSPFGREQGNWGHPSDATNLEDGNLADLGFDDEDDDEEEENGEEGNVGAAQAPEGGTLNRVLFDLQEGAQRNPRPLVRTPRAPPPGSNAAKCCPMCRNFS